MKPEERTLLDRLAKLNVGKSVERRAPHKPLLLLLAIADIQKQMPRLRPYVEIEDRLGRALTIFGRPAKRQNPQYPFWRLQNDKVWQIESDGPMASRQSNSDPPRSQLVARRARGGFLPEHYDALFGNEELQSRVIHQVLDAHFPASMHDDIAAFFDLRVRPAAETGELSEFEFRREVLQAYGLQCAVSGYSVTAAGFPLGVEAAYIQWPQSGGASRVRNGIALTTLHRKLFDLGMFTITNQMRVRVSSCAHGPEGFAGLVRRFDDHRIFLPSDADCQPSRQSLEWHASEVFRG